ncbi:MAG: HAMP domain-containing sensor histidine kinase [Cyanobacteriota bacterium]|nr:HAMP domain-containing sensor histidine kinase [Cyanobacteriota bacterium]
MVAAWLAAALAFACGLLIGQRRDPGPERSRERLEPTRDQLLSWLDQAPQGWLIVDRGDRLRFINRRAIRLLQLPAAGQPPSHVDDLGVVAGLRQLLEDVRLQRQAKRLEVAHKGQELEAFAFAGQGEWVALLLQSRRSLEAQLHQQERWVSDVAHELKTPLTALLLVGDSLAAGVTDRNAVLVERLLKELRRMQDLVADLLELSRLENVLPGQGIPLERIEVPSLLKEAWQGIVPLAEDKGLRLQTTVPEPHQPLLVQGDRKRLHRALLNLFDNALRHSPTHGSIFLEVNASGDWLRIAIRDQGPGLSEQDLEHMFERFYRGDSSRYRHHRGASGLGLAIVQQIVLAHGGWILGDNDPSGGARFELRLPLLHPTDPETEGG